MREDYQAIVDEVSALLGTPATLEGRDFALIAFGAHQSDGEGNEPALDPVRTRSILGRGSTAEVRAWFESLGITKATEPVRIDPEPAAGVVHGRICLPVRYAGVVYGYIWLIDDGAIDLSDPRLVSAMAVTSRIGALLAAEARTEARTGELLREMLGVGGGERSGAGEETIAQLREALGTDGSGPLALVAITPWQVAEGADAAGTSASAQPHVTARCVLPAATGRGAARATSAHSLAALVRLRSMDGLDPARTAAGRLLRTPGSPANGTRTGTSTGTSTGTAGISAPRRGLAELLPAWREAMAAARAARAEEALGPVAEWTAIGPYRLLTSLHTDAGPDPVLRALLRPAHAELARTAEVFLDSAGQAGRTAAALGIHRQTLYYRLSRVESLTGLDLDEGAARLLLHMALKAQRL